METTVEDTTTAEGTEQPTAEDQTQAANVTDALKDAEKASQDFDKDRQRADQAEASLRRERGRREQLESRLAEQETQARDLAAKVEELSAVKGAKDQVDELLPDLDPERAGIEDYAKALGAVKGIIREQNRKLAALETASGRLTAEQKAAKEAEAADRTKNAIFEKVCSRLEKKHGIPGLRNRAIELFQDKSLDDSPSNPAEAALLLDECFAQAKTERAKPKPTPASKRADAVMDTGGGGSSPYPNVKIKTGSLDEVANQFEQAARSG